MEMTYQIKKDVNTTCDSFLLTEDEFANRAGISLRTLQDAYKGIYTLSTIEKIYDAIYELGLRLNLAKTELYKEELGKDEILLFHGSKLGITTISKNGSRDNCDFGNGFYCSELYSSAICFIESYDNSSIYYFKTDLKGLNCIEIPASIEWMVLVCYFRGSLKQYQNHPKLVSYLNKIMDKDVIIAPIADNRMFQIMTDFGKENITDVEAIHALSASRLGKQYIFKTDKAIKKLKFLEHVYCSKNEREESKKLTEDRKKVIDTKLHLAKREYRHQGVFIDEVFK